MVDLGEGLFSENFLNQFRQLVFYSYCAKKINQKNFQKLKKWCEEEQNMFSNDYAPHNIDFKDLYGFAYFQDDKIHYIQNAYKDYINEKIALLKKNCHWVGPLYHEKIWYDARKQRPFELMQEFEKKFKSYYDENYLYLLYGLTRAKNPSTDYYLHSVKEEFGEYALDTLKIYFTQWGLLG